MIRTKGVGLALLATLMCVGSQDVDAAPIAGVTAASGTPIGFNAVAGLATLTNGVIDDDDWLTTPWTSLGWLDAGWNLNPANSVDTGVVQPSLTFNLGGVYVVDSVTVHYTIDHLAGDDTRNLRAPDSMTATFSATGVGGAFLNPVVQTGWDDSDAGDGTDVGVGDARSLTTSLGAVASAVRLDFLTNAEWLFFSEITFDGRAVPEPATLGSLVLACACVSAGLRRRP
jgi:hypothetical protein